jgi:hypothetical protein
MCADGASSGRSGLLSETATGKEVIAVFIFPRMAFAGKLKSRWPPSARSGGNLRAEARVTATQFPISPHIIPSPAASRHRQSTSKALPSQLPPDLCIVLS